MASLADPGALAVDPSIRRPIRRSGSGLLLGVIVPLAFLLFWEVAVRSGWWPQQIVAAPTEVLARFGKRFSDGTLWLHSVASMKRLLAGFLIGGILGTILGFGAGIMRPLERLLGPVVRLLAPIPPVAWIPLLVIVFGIGEWSKLGLLAIGTFFVLYLASFEAVRTTDQRLVDVARVFEKSTWDLTWTVFVPSALPQVLVGARTALALSWILLIAAEVIASSDGLGWFIWDSRNFSRPADMVVGMIAVGILGGATDWLVVRVSSRFLSWRTDYQAEG